MATNVHSFEAKKLKTKHVTVYCDRAEVNKVIKVNLTKGTNEVVVKKLADAIHGDSIRVEGFGSAVISEVKYNEKRVTKEELKETEKDLVQKLEKLKDEKSAVEQNNERLKKQREVLNGIADQISKGKEKSKSDALSTFLSEKFLDNLEKFFEFYARRTGEIDSELNEVQKKLEKLTEEISVIDTNINDNQCCAYNMEKEVSIFVKADADDTEGTLDLYYVVFNASWSPSYDIRVIVKEQITKLTYYGVIEQNTDEDWIDAKVALSTAMPSIGGQVPELGTTKVSFYKPPALIIQAKAEEEHSVGGALGASAGLRSAPERRRSLSADYDAEAMEHELTKVKENVTSTTFEIETPTSIPSDSAKHKVIIITTIMKPEFFYEAVPSKSTFAYYRAKLVNSSKCPFLAGPTAIFIENTFVAKGEMKAVNVDEKFDISLGIDPAIKIEYKAARKFQEETGILTKSYALTHEQRIVVINTKSETVKIVVLETLPQSTEEKIKVVLVEPVVKTDKIPHAVVNKENNIEWHLTMAANDKKELVLKYHIDHPKGEQLEFREE